MQRIIKTFIHNEENGVYVINISDHTSPVTIRKIMNMLLEEEERQFTQPPPTGGLESVVE